MSSKVLWGWVDISSPWGCCQRALSPCLQISLKGLHPPLVHSQPARLPHFQDCLPSSFPEELKVSFQRTRWLRGRCLYSLMGTQHTIALTFSQLSLRSCFSLASLGAVACWYWFRTQTLLLWMRTPGSGGWCWRLPAWLSSTTLCCDWIMLVLSPLGSLVWAGALWPPSQRGNMVQRCGRGRVRQGQVRWQLALGYSWLGRHGFKIKRKGHKTEDILKYFALWVEILLPFKRKLCILSLYELQVTHQWLIPRAGLEVNLHQERGQHFEMKWDIIRTQGHRAESTQECSSSPFSSSQTIIPSKLLHFLVLQTVLQGVFCHGSVINEPD